MVRPHYEPKVYDLVLIARHGPIESIVLTEKPGKDSY